MLTSTLSVPRLEPLVPLEVIERRIYLIRGEKVMLDRDLAELYQVKAIALRQQLKRNIGRFPPDFMFQLLKPEAEALLSQSVIPSGRSLGGSLPYAFTEQGVAMLSSVLRSERAMEVNIAIMRTFVRLHRMAATHEEFARKLARLEQKYEEHDAQILGVFEAIRELMTPESPPTKRRIGFAAGKR